MTTPRLQLTILAGAAMLWLGGLVLAPACSGDQSVIAGIAVVFVLAGGCLIGHAVAVLEDMKDEAEGRPWQKRR